MLKTAHFLRPAFPGIGGESQQEVYGDLPRSALLLHPAYGGLRRHALRTD